MATMEFEREIAEVRAIKRFGEGLGLVFNGAFNEHNGVAESYRIYWVYGSCKDRIEPVTGDGDGRPHESFMDEGVAERQVKQLRSWDYDVLCKGGSVSGSDSCPISRSLLAYSLIDRVGALLHEGTHISLREWGANMPYCLEEAVCTYIGHVGALEFLEGCYADLIEGVRAEIRDWLRFVGFVNRHYQGLSAFYDHMGRENRDVAWQPVLEEAKVLKKECGPRGIGRLYPNGVNNAFFVRSRNYTQCTPLVWRMFGDEGISVRDYLANPHGINERLKERIRKA